ncbi:MAG: hypothetical protein ACTSUE_24875 [Promethearchaeota archaeon]
MTAYELDGDDHRCWTTCAGCGGAIYFGKHGSKWVPMDEDGDPHRCKTECRDCGKDVVVEWTVKGERHLRERGGEKDGDDHQCWTTCSRCKRPVFFKKAGWRKVAMDDGCDAHRCDPEPCKGCGRDVVKVFDFRKKMETFIDPATVCVHDCDD